MPTIREITIGWQVEGGAPATSVLHFDPAPTPDSQVTALNAFLTRLATYLSTTTTARVASEGREFEDTTGVLTGTWSTTVPSSIGGQTANGPVPNASQGLLRFRTAAVVNGRVLQGRLFIPGLTIIAVSGGGVQEAARIAIQAAWREELGPPANQLLWSRPFAGAVGPPSQPACAGSSSAVIDTSMWSELAVLRRRR